MKNNLGSAFPKTPAEAKDLLRKFPNEVTLLIRARIPKGYAYDTDDLINEVMLGLLETGLEKYDPSKASLGTYISNAVQFKVQTSFNKVNKNNRIALMDDFSTMIAQSDDESVDDIEAMLKYLDSQNNICKRIIRGLYWEGRTLEQLATETGYSLSRVHQIAQGFRENCRKALEAA